MMIQIQIVSSITTGCTSNEATSLNLLDAQILRLDSQQSLVGVERTCERSNWLAQHCIT